MSHETLTQEQREQFLKRFGSHCIAFSTLQPGLKYIDDPELGYVAYKSVGLLFRTHFVLGDPICPPSRIGDLLDRTIAALGSPVFVQTSRRVAKALVDRGYYANQLGIETRLDLQKWSLHGKDNQDLRRELNRVARGGFEIDEICIDQIDPSALDSVNRQWLAERPLSAREQAFLNAPLTTMFHVDTRVFQIRRVNETYAYVFFTPVYRNGKPVGYNSDVTRRRPSELPGFTKAINTAAALAFQAEGIETLYLGMSPGCRIEDLDSWNSVFTTLCFTAIFQLANWTYRFKGLARSKRSYHGQEEHVYFCSRRAFPVLAIPRLFAACNIYPVRDLFGSLFRRLKPEKRPSQETESVPTCGKTSILAE